MGLYPAGGNPWGSTFHQGDGNTPDAMAASPSSQCTAIPNLQVNVGPASSAAANSSSSSVSITSTSTVVATVTASASSAASLRPAPSVTSSAFNGAVGFYQIPSMGWWLAVGLSVVVGGLAI